MSSKESLYCPDWMFDVIVARTASEYIKGHLDLSIYAQKYSQEISKNFMPIGTVEIAFPAEDMLRFLDKIEAGDLAVSLLHDFSHFRLYYIAQGRERKLNPFFGHVEDGVREKAYSDSNNGAQFRSFVFSIRSKLIARAPDAWKLEEDENFPFLSELVKYEITALDIFHTSGF